jgi:hypothetical protein
MNNLKPEPIIFSIDDNYESINIFEKTIRSRKMKLLTRVVNSLGLLVACLDKRNVIEFMN